METELCFSVILMVIGVVASQKAIYGRNEYISFECPKSVENLPEDCPFFILEVRSDKERVARGSGYNTMYSDSMPFTGRITTDNAGTANISCYMRCGTCGDFRWPVLNGEPSSLLDPSASREDRRALQEAQKAIAEHNVQALQTMLATGKLGLKLQTRVMAVLENHYPEIAEKIKSEHLVKSSKTTSTRRPTTRTTATPLVGVLPKQVATEATTKRSTPAPRTTVAEQEPHLPASGDGSEVSGGQGPYLPVDPPYYTIAPTLPTFGPPTEECPEYYLGSEVITVMDQATEYRRATISAEGLTIKPFDIDIPGVTKEIVWEVLQYHTEVSEIPSHLTPVEDVITVPPGTYDASYEVRTKTIYYEPINMIVVLNGFEVPEEVPATAPANFWFYANPTSADKVNITLSLGGVDNYQLNTCSKVVVTYHTGQKAFKAESSKGPIVFTNVPNTGFLCAKGEDGFITESCRPVLPQGDQCGGDYPQIIDHM